MTLKGLNVGYVHPHYYFDAKGVHTILFYPKGSQHETDDKDGTYYNTLKEIVENDEENLEVIFSLINIARGHDVDTPCPFWFFRHME